MPTPAPDADGRDAEVARLRAALRDHPCHDCPEREEHLRWADRLWQARREHRRLSEGLARRQSSIAAAFDRVCSVLSELGYLDGDAVTTDGDRLRGLFFELDLLAAESLRQRVWSGLSPPELAACVSVLTYQTRGAEPAPSAHPPSAGARRALETMGSIWADLHEVEAAHRLAYLREPDAGFARPAYRWAAGHSLAAVLSEAEATPGDLVRAMRQVLDTLDQVADVAGQAGDLDTARTARAAARAVNRGVVAYDVPG